MAGKATPERRRAVRTPMISGGRIVAGGVSSGCVVLDMSIYGARIHLLAPEPAPEKAVLQLPGGVVRKACRRWQSEAVAGYEFCLGTEEPGAA